MQDYLERYYLPASERYRERLTAGRPREIRDWLDAVENHWDEVSFGDLSVSTVDTPEGRRHALEAKVQLGSLPLDAVRVELYADPLGDSAPERHLMLPTPVKHGGGKRAAGMLTYRAVLPADRPATDYTPRVVPWHEGALVPIETKRILWFH